MKVASESVADTRELRRGTFFKGFLLAATAVLQVAYLKLN